MTTSTLSHPITLGHLHLEPDKHTNGHSKFKAQGFRFLLEGLIVNERRWILDFGLEVFLGVHSQRPLQVF